MSWKKLPLTVVLADAAGDIGSAIARVLADEGHRMVLVGRDIGKLQQLKAALPDRDRHLAVAVDLSGAAQRNALVGVCKSLPGGVDVLINNAGVSGFAMLGGQGDGEINSMLYTNLIAPIALTRDLLPLLQCSEYGALINIGSAFGHIGHPGFSVYSASKFGLHGFTEALRRELMDTGVAVHYLAPRAVDAGPDGEALDKLNCALRTRSDLPEEVALQVLRLLDRPGSGRGFIGWPEQLLIKLNALCPLLVDRVLCRRMTVIRRYARPEPTCGGTL